MATKISNAAAKAAADAVVDLIDAGVAAGKLRIYDGAQPADPDTAVGAQVLLAELTFADPAFGAAADGAPGGVATANAITADAAANATGTASWFRVVDSAGNAIFDGAVGTSGAQLNLATVSIVQNVEVQVTSFTYTQPES